MSNTDLASVIRRAISDAAFRRQLQADPKGALKGFSLTSAESAAITSGDPAKLSALGVDQRMSKAFIISGPASAQSAASGSDLGATQTALSDENPAGAQDALITGNADAAQSAIVGDPSTAQSTLAAANAAWPDDALATGAAVDDSGSNAVIDPGTVSSQSVFLPPDAADRQRELLASMNDTNAEAMAAGRSGSLAGPSGADTFQAAPVEGSPEAAVIDAGTTTAQSSLAAANAAWPDDALIADATAGGRNALADANTAWPDDALSTGAGIDDSGTNAIIDPGSVDTTGDALVQPSSGPESGDEHGWG